MEQHGVRAYLSFSKTPTFVGTGELVLLHVSGRWTLSTMVSIGLDLILLLLVFRYQLFPSFRRGGLLLSSSFLPLAEETVDPSWTPFLLAVKISDRRCFFVSPRSHPSSDMDALSSAALWVGVHGQVGVQGQVSGLDFPVRGIFPVQLGPFMTLVSSVDLAGRKGETLCFFGIVCVCEHFFCWAWRQNQSA